MRIGNGKKRRDPARERQWRGRIRQQGRSGLSVRAFCEQHKLPETAFYFWRRELARRDGASPRPRVASRPSHPAKSSPKRARRPRWAQLRVTPAELARPGAAIEIVWPSGVCVRLSQRVDRQALVEVLAALEPRAC